MADVRRTSQPTADALGDTNAKCAERCAAEVKALCSLPKPNAGFPVFFVPMTAQPKRLQRSVEWQRRLAEWQVGVGLLATYRRWNGAAWRRVTMESQSLLIK